MILMVCEYCCLLTLFETQKPLVLVVLVISLVPSLVESWSYSTFVVSDLENTIYYSMNETNQLSNGAGGSFIVGVTGSKGGAQVRRALIRFNLTKLWEQVQSYEYPIPASAYVELTVRKIGQFPCEVEMYQLESPWGEGSSNASLRPGRGVPSRPGDASWLYSFYPHVKWRSAGGDYTPYLIATKQVVWYETYQWSSETLLAQLNSLVLQPEENFGWLLKAQDETRESSAKEFFGRLNHDPQTRPRLIVNFVAQPPIWLWIVVGCGIFMLVAILSFAYHVVRNKQLEPEESYTSVRNFEEVFRGKENLQNLFEEYSIRVVPLSRLKLGKIIGKGVSGAVFSASLPNGKKVALKKVNLNLEEGDLNVGAIEEIKIMSSVEHPNILSLIGISLGEVISDVILITPLIDGGNLANFLFSTKKRFKFLDKVDLVLQVAYGMHYLHSVRPRIIHRDLKPENILLTTSGLIKIADFGMSKMIQNYCKTMTTIGTPHYMAPEVISKGRFSEKSDVYSYGIVIWETYVCKRAYEDMDNAFQVMRKVVSEHLRPKIPQDCPLSYSQIIQSCFQNKAQDRPNFQNIIQAFKAIELTGENNGNSNNCNNHEDYNDQTTKTD
eukprot:TRINITY_DN12785_c0_g1_i1.p1 TRINITY_DN12785_c0_g1~~TRINITY_DN12785_c0_g1_i1.p1  ORF type:complete len:610 (-),score=82.06 TRINITY_DN12785_c0_g1_i1:45-1874(-)